MSKLIPSMNVLIVEDEVKISELIRIFLQTQFKFNSIITAESAATAIQKCQNQEFDLIIIDHIMPGRLGLEFIEKTKNSPKFLNTKYVLISGYLEQTDVLKAINLGVKNIVVKPFTRQQIVEQVQSAISD